MALLKGLGVAYVAIVRILGSKISTIGPSNSNFDFVLIFEIILLKFGLILELAPWGPHFVTCFRFFDFRKTWPCRQIR